MTNKNIYRELGGLAPDLISKAAPDAVQKKSANKMWVKWGAMAACLCIMFVSVFMIHNYNQNQEIPQKVIFNNVEYTICGNEGEASILEEANLPAIIAEEHAGKQIAYLDVNGNVFSITETPTDCVLFEYAPYPNDNVYIVLIDGEYYAAIRYDSNGYHGITE